MKSKPHFEVLDGLRGIAAIIVICFHVFEAHATSHYDQIINHGYLAVDFFFALSGFVIGHSYDDRWDKMSIKEFFKQRIIRLHPMIILASILGALLFYFGAGSNVEQTSIGTLIVCTIIACFLFPLPLHIEIRGWGEMYPINGPQWTLFFEYIANILYALFIRHFSKKILILLVFATGCLTVHFLFDNNKGDIVGGWALTKDQIYIGFIRLLYPFFSGLLLSRIKLSIRLPHPFLCCSLIIILLLSMPRIGDATTIWMNAIYESMCILLLFPLIIIIGSSAKTSSGKNSNSICNILGGISYPLYLIHYPFIYMYFKYIGSKEATLEGSWLRGTGLIVICLLLAYIVHKYYDIPIRKWLKTTR